MRLCADDPSPDWGAEESRLWPGLYPTGVHVGNFTIKPHFDEDDQMANKVLGMHHIGITVPNIEEGIAFFKAVFGAVEVFHTGPFDVDQDFMKNKLGAAAHSTIRDLVFLRCGEGTSVELFEYGGEEASRPKRPSEVGGMHLCFEV